MMVPAPAVQKMAGTQSRSLFYSSGRGPTSSSQRPPYCNLPGYLKAVWPEFFGSVLGAWAAPWGFKTIQKCGGEAPYILGWFQSPQGPPRPQKPTQKHPARLPSGTQTFGLQHPPHFCRRPAAPSARRLADLQQGRPALVAAAVHGTCSMRMCPIVGG